MDPILLPEKCPESARITVRFTQESLSGISRNQCPLYARITVRNRQESVSGMGKNMQLKQMKENKFLDVQNLAEYIHMSESYVYKMVSKNTIPHIKLGSRTLFERNEIDNWVINGSRMEDNLPSLPKV